MTHTPDSILLQVMEHLVKQGVPAYNFTTGTCLYRGPNGIKCAIGCLFPDEEYRMEMEGKAITKLLTSSDYVTPTLKKIYQDLSRSSLGERALNFLDFLQEIHDFFTGNRDKAHFDKSYLKFKTEELYRLFPNIKSETKSKIEILIESIE